MPADRIGAAVDVGSNSVHLLVARFAEQRLEPLRDESTLLGLGDFVDRDGRVAQPAQLQLGDVLARYVQLARIHGAASISLFATEPLRRAANGAQVASDFGRQLGLPVHVLSEQQEGELTYLGVTGARPSVETLLVVDIGGGSSEVIVAEPGRAPSVASLPTGSSRLSGELVSSDPPTLLELGALREAARARVAVLAESRPARAIFVGGTATNLARMARLRRDGFARAYQAIVDTPSAELSRRFGVNLRRARQLAAGAALVEALLEHFGLDEAETSEASLRDGAIIAAARLGERWPERLSELLVRANPG